MLTRQNCEKTLFFSENLQILVLRRVYFYFNFMGVLGGWWHKVRARGSKRGIILNMDILLSINIVAPIPLEDLMP